MSRKRRERGDAPENLLNELSNNEIEAPLDGTDFTASSIADAAYGSIVGHDDPFAQMGRGREKLIPKPIDAIYPNVTQPRRPIPSSLRHYWTGEPDYESVQNLFTMWLNEIQAETGQSFPLDDYLNGAITPRSQNISTTELDQIGTTVSLKPLEAALMKVVELAASIHRDGLTNPISIAQVGNSYEIETGERRWLAYHLLNWRFSHISKDWEKIPARVVETVSIWRQANENNLRADLNAIGKARQFALLLMDVMQDKGVLFQPYTAYEHEQDFYAQVRDGQEFRIPHGSGEQILNAMGLENAVQLRQYRALLRLPRPVWEWADDLNWTESFIRKELFAKANNTNDLIRLAVQQALNDGYSVSSVTEYMPLLENQAKKPARVITYQAFTEGLGTKVYHYVKQLKGKERQQAIVYLKELVDALEQDS